MNHRLGRPTCGHLCRSSRRYNRRYR